MRRILFRGKAVTGRNAGEWYYGDLRHDGTPHIVKQKINGGQTCGLPYNVEVDEDTVGQFSDFYDSNGTEIYDGDLLTSHAREPLLVKYDESTARWWLCDGTGYHLFHLTRTWCILNKPTVIGNRWDDPEKMIDGGQFFL